MPVSQASAPAQPSTGELAIAQASAQPAQATLPQKSGGVPTWMAVFGLLFCFPVGIVLTLLTHWSTKAKAITIVAVLAIVVFVGASASYAPKATPVANVGARSPTASPSSEAPSQSPASVSSPTTAPPSPSAAPSPAPTSTPSTQPVAKAPAPIVFSGKGSKVRSVTLAEAPYRVTWSATGYDNMIVKMRLGSEEQLLVNEIPPKPAGGQVFFDSPGGGLILEVQAATLSWKITFAQVLWPQNPNPIPSPTKISFSGTGSKVTNPVYIPTGNYDLAWTAKGHDNFIVTVVWSSGDNLLVNENAPDPADGETVFYSGGAQHLFAIEASTLTWTMTLTPI